MTIYRKCRPCKHRDDCEIKDALSAALKGFGVGTISHRCRAFTPDFEPSDNLWVRTFDVPQSEESPTLAVFPAHFVQYSRTLGRAIVFIAPDAVSQCGKYTFVPATRGGFCKVSYAPYRAAFQWSRQKGIIGRREGRTPVNSCCGRPFGATCDECSSFATSSLAEIW